MLYFEFFTVGKKTFITSTYDKMIIKEKLKQVLVIFYTSYPSAAANLKVSFSIDMNFKWPVTKRFELELFL